MELLIFSDSHGRGERMGDALSLQRRRPDGICFLGDGLRDTESLSLTPIPLYTVRGNCDFGVFFEDADTERLLFFEGHALLLTHGHTYGVKSGEGALIARAAALGADIVLFGHTHTPTERVLPSGSVIGGAALSRPMYLFNPGSIGYEGFFGTLLLKGDTVLFSHGRV